MCAYSGALRHSARVIVSLAEFRPSKHFEILLQLKFRFFYVGMELLYPKHPT